MIALGLGGNVGSDDDIVARFRAVAEAFRAHGFVRASPVFRTAPIGPDQSWFLNAALSVRTASSLSPSELLSLILATEQALGRDRTRETRWGPRPIDIDVLVWDGHAGRYPVGALVLELPHPRLPHRRFALEPLAALLGDTHQLLGRSLRAWLDDVSAQELARTPLRI